MEKSSLQKLEEETKKIKNEDKFTKSKRAEALNQKRPPGHRQS